jgi:hypothetical protein
MKGGSLLEELSALILKSLDGPSKKFIAMQVLLTPLPI